jgi:hypothetical protein
LTIDSSLSGATDRYYSRRRLGKSEGHNIRIGLSDFLQQRSGDIYFAEIMPVEPSGIGDEVAVIRRLSHYQPGPSGDRHKILSRPGRIA